MLASPSCRAEDVLGEAGEALRWFPYPWEGCVSQETTPHLASPGSLRRRVILPKVYLQGVGRDLEAFDATIDGSSVDRRENDGSEGAAGLAEGGRTVTPAERASIDGNAVTPDKDVKQVCALATDNGRRVPDGIEGEIGRSGDEEGADDVMLNVLEEHTGLKPTPNVSLHSLFCIFILWSFGGFDSFWREYTKRSFRFILILVRQV